MARAMRPAAGAGPGMFGTIFSMVLALLLIGACAMLWVAFSRADFARKEMIQLIKAGVADPLKAKGMVLREQPATEPHATPYGADFFKDVRDAAEKGLLYDALTPLHGWPADSAPQDIKTALDQAGQPDLNKLGAALRRDLDGARTQIRSLQKSLSDAQGDQRAAQARLKATQQDLAKKMKAADAKLTRLTAGLRRDVDRYKREADKSSALRKKAWGELEKDKAARRAEVNALKKVIAEKDEKIGKLQALLDKKFKRPVKVTHAAVLRIDPVNRFAIIDRGKRDGVETGEKFTIFAAVRGAKKVKKGVVMVVRVNELTSIVDVVSESEADPIIAGDKAERHKKVKAPYEP